MASEIHINDIGTQLRITVLDGDSAVDLSSATLKQVELRKPDNTSVTRTASLFGDGSGSSGVMYYNTVAGDFDQTGNYKLQGKVSLTSGTYYTDVYTFKVHCNL
jgi:hypothetical protein